MKKLISELIAKQEAVNQTFDKIEKKLDECKSGMRKALKCSKDDIVVSFGASDASIRVLQFHKSGESRFAEFQYVKGDWFRTHQRSPIICKEFYLFVLNFLNRDQPKNNLDNLPDLSQN